ncbi:hypothetical protein AB4K20DRAFT_1866250 [Rhizopus microsporus]|uniref:Uncharacterized protein n=1 Tax=Rhizopus microsporus TaxID=58291 RepID=A0A1X0SGG8_RHIZD|nr:hypothetical protein BCV71DRAFT_275208 [Rhizopus microsporus]
MPYNFTTPRHFEHVKEPVAIHPGFQLMLKTALQNHSRNGVLLMSSQLTSSKYPFTLIHSIHIIKGLILFCCTIMFPRTFSFRTASPVDGKQRIEEHHRHSNSNESVVPRKRPANLSLLSYCHCQERLSI